MLTYIRGFNALGVEIFRGEYIFKYIVDAAIEAQNIREDYPAIVRIIIDVAL